LFEETRSTSPKFDLSLFGRAFEGFLFGAGVGILVSRYKKLHKWKK
jgi:hypothetical protein